MRVVLACVLVMVFAQAKQRGKTYDDLEDMLNKANQKIDEQQKQHNEVTKTNISQQISSKIDQQDQ